MNWKNIKISKWIIIALCMIFAFQVVSNIYDISKNLEKKESEERKVWLIGKGPYFLDTIYGNYQHLVVDFPLVELNPLANQLIEIEGYENGKRYVDTYFKNDTLYVMRKQPESDTIVVAIDEDYAAIVRVGGLSLESITLLGSGHIDIPANPYGANPGGPIVYKPEDWEKYVLRKDKLKLISYDEAVGDFFLEVKNLEIKVTNNVSSFQPTNSYNYNIPTLFLVGSAQRTELINPSGIVSVHAPNLVSDTVIVRSDPETENWDMGNLSIHCNDYLEADLLYNMDVSYLGNPKVHKRERDLGRVVNLNERR